MKQLTDNQLKMLTDAYLLAESAGKWKDENLSKESLELFRVIEQELLDRGLINESTRYLSWHNLYMYGSNNFETSEIH